MAAATVTQTPFGYYVTGDTGVANVLTTRLRVKNFQFVPAANGDSVTMTDLNGNIVYAMVQSTVTSENDHFDEGIPFNGLNVTLSNGSAKLFICVV